MHKGSGHDVKSISLAFHEKAVFVKRCTLGLQSDAYI